MASESNNESREALIEKFQNEVSKTTRRRSPTMLKLQWLAERVRRAERIKAELNAGTYHVDSKRVARAMLNLDVSEEQA